MKYGLFYHLNFSFPRFWINSLKSVQWICARRRKKHIVQLKSCKTKEQFRQLVYGFLTFYGEYITALQQFAEHDLTFNGHGAKPKALDFEMLYGFLMWCLAPMCFFCTGAVNFYIFGARHRLCSCSAEVYM